MPMSIGKQIKSYRNKQKLTQSELAKRSNISRSYLADVESDRYNPSLETLKAVANALNIDTYILLGEKESELSQVYEDAGTTKKLIDTLIIFLNENNHFIEKFHKELFLLFYDSLGTGSEGERFNAWYEKYLKSSEEEKTDSDHEYAIEEFNNIYDFNNVKRTILNSSSLSIKEHLLNELIIIADKHNIKNSPSLVKEKELSYSIDLPIEELINRNLTFKGQKLTDEQKEHFTKIIQAAAEMLKR